MGISNNRVNSFVAPKTTIKLANLITHETNLSKQVNTLICPAVCSLPTVHNQQYANHKNFTCCNLLSEILLLQPTDTLSNLCDYVKRDVYLNIVKRRQYFLLVRL